MISTDSARMMAEDGVATPLGVRELAAEVVKWRERGLHRLPPSFTTDNAQAAYQALFILWKAVNDKDYVFDGQQLGAMINAAHGDLSWCLGCRGIDDVVTVVHSEDMAGPMCLPCRDAAGIPADVERI